MKSLLIAVSIIIILLLFCTLVFFFWFGNMKSIHVKPKPKDGQIRIACVGDSITHGCMVANRRQNNYPHQLEKLLGDNYCVGNFGFSARTATKSGDFPYVKEALYRQSLDFQPNIVLLMLGTNDSKPYNWNEKAYKEDMISLIQHYRSLPSKPQIYLLLPPPVFKFGKKVWYDINADVINIDVCKIVKELSEELNLPFIDMHTVFEYRKDLFADGVHPNKQGARLFAKNVYKALTEQNLSC